MDSSHDKIVVSCIIHAADAPREKVGGICERNIVLQAGSTLQNLLEEIDDGSFDLCDVTVNGLSVSRLSPLLTGDVIDVHMPAVIDVL